MHTVGGQIIINPPTAHIGRRIAEIKEFGPLAAVGWGGHKLVNQHKRASSRNAGRGAKTGDAKDGTGQ